MYFYFNELCIGQTLNDQNAAHEALSEFVIACRAMTYRGFQGIIAVEEGTFNNLTKSEISPGYHVYSWLKDPAYDYEIRNLLRTILSTSPSLDLNEDESCKMALTESRLLNNGAIAKGFNIAYLRNAITISILNAQQWDTDEVSLIHYDLLADYANPESEITVRHIAKITPHLQSHLSWIVELTQRALLSSTWNPAKDYFPRTDDANLSIVNSDWPSYYRSLYQLGGQDKIAACLTKGEEIARIHGYEYDSKISAKNSSKNVIRKIYSAGQGKDRIYLSIDIRHGHFEVCAHDGAHLGAYDFSGALQDGDEEDHSIRV